MSRLIFSIELKPDAYSKLKRISRERGVTMGALIRLAIHDWLRRELRREKQ